MLIGLVDLDVLYQTTYNKPSIELMLASSYYKRNKHIVKMIYNLEEVDKFDKLIVYKGLKAKERYFELPNILKKANCDFYGEYFNGGATSTIPEEWFGNGVGDSTIYRGVDTRSTSRKTQNIFNTINRHLPCKFSQKGKLIVDKVPLGNEKICLYDKDIFLPSIYPFILKLGESHTIGLLYGQTTDNWNKFCELSRKKCIVRDQKNAFVKFAGLPTVDEAIKNIDVFSSTFVLQQRLVDPNTSPIFIMKEMFEVGELIKTVMKTTGKIIRAYPTLDYQQQERNPLINFSITFFYYTYYSNPTKYSFVDYITLNRSLGMFRTLGRIKWAYPALYNLLNEKWS